MHFLLPAASIVLLVFQAVAAECRTVTYLYDGAIVEFEATAAKGVIEIPLPPRLVEDSLRIKPLGGSIQRVEILAASKDDTRNAREPESLQEQKSRLEDRLKALATREEIFKAAAKSQSGKAPRKSKTNPDPLQGIRQGTDFAIAQLEAVYTARRKTEQEIRRIDSRIAQAKQEKNDLPARARVLVSPARGRVLVRYAVTGQGWTPVYDLFLNSDSTALLRLSGRFDGSYPGYRRQAAPATLSDTATAPFAAPPGEQQGMAEFRLTVSGARFGTGVRNSFSFELNNPAAVQLPAGEANLYRGGEYLGRFRFEGMSSGKSRVFRSE